MNQLINKYYKLIDAFLLEQFKMAMKQSNSDSVAYLHNSIVSFLEGIKFKNNDFESARSRHINMFKGVSILMGFSQLENLSPDVSNNTLNNIRSEIDTSLFSKKLEEFSNMVFDEKGLNLSVPICKWEDIYDLNVDINICPNKLKSILFNISGFHTDYKYNFQVSPVGSGFFMMTLNLQNLFYIGYRPALTLFSTSTLAHELGHTTTPIENINLQKKFLEVGDELLLNNEMDSYKYEYLFAKNINEILNQLGSTIKNKNFEALLLKRKAIKYNQHLMAVKLNQLYFSGSKIDIIRKEFTKMMVKFYPSFVENNKLDWIQFSTLSKPISKLGYLEAYQKVFLSNKTNNQY